MENKHRKELEVIDILNKAGSTLIMEFNWGPSLLVSLSKTHIEHPELTYHDLIEMSGYSLIGKLETLGLQDTLHSNVNTLLGGSQVVSEFNTHAVSNKVIRTIGYLMLAVSGYLTGVLTASFYSVLKDMSFSDILDILNSINNF